MSDAQAIAAPDRAGTPSDARRWWILALCGLGQLMVVLDATIVTIALPHAQAALGFSMADRQWVITAYSLAFGGLLLLGGRLADLLGRRLTFIVGLVGFGLASAAGGFSTDFTMLVIARACQGAFGALLAPSTLSLLTTTFSEPSERGRAFGVFGAIAGSGAAIGLLLGGALTEYADWRWCLYVNVIMAAVAVTAALVLLQRSERAADTHIDIPGATLVVAGLAALVYGFSEAAVHGWGAALTIGLLVASVVLLTAFALVERRLTHPLLPLSVVLDRNRGGSYLAIGLLAIGMFGVFLFLTYFLQDIRGYSPFTAGAAFLPMIAALMVSSISCTTKLLPRFGPRPLVVVGSLLAAGGMLILAQLSVTTSYVTGVVPALVVMGLGLGACFGAAINMATYGTTEENAGVASALVSTGQQVGGSIGTALLNTIATSVTASYLATHGRPTRLLQSQAAVHADDVSFYVAVGILVFAAAVCGLVYRPGRPILTEEPALAAA